MIDGRGKHEVSVFFFVSHKKTCGNQPIFFFFLAEFLVRRRDVGN